jgi:hypothetical protein
MPKSQAFRLILVGSIFIVTAMSVMRFFEGDGSHASEDEFAPPQVIHVARDKATIVRPNDDWMNQSETTGDVQPIPATSPLDSNDVDDASYLAPPMPLESPDESAEFYRR